MFGFTSIAETPFATEKATPTIGVDIANVAAQALLTAVTTQANASLPAVTGVSAATANGTLDFDAKSNITIANVLSTLSVAALTLTGKGNITSASVTTAPAINVPSISGKSNTTLPTPSELATEVQGNFLQDSTYNYTVTVVNSGGNKYALNGEVAPELTLLRGNTYVFDVSDSSNSGHPLRFKDSSGASFTSAVIVNGTAGQAGATVSITLPITTAHQPARYYCTIHGNGMGNTINTMAGTTEFAVTVANDGSGNKYVIDGIYAPTLSLVRGKKYTFDLSDSSLSGHPLRFKDGSGSSYSSGVVVTGTPGTSGAKVEFTVPSNAPLTGLRYYCTVHGNGMGNTLVVAPEPPAAITAEGQASVTPSTLLATFSQTLPEVTGPANFTIGAVNAAALKNAVTATGVLFNFDEIATEFSRARSVVILPFNVNRTIHVMPENRTVVVRPVNRHNVVYITN